MEIDEVHNNVEEQQRVASEDLERKRMLEVEKQLEKRRVEEEMERERLRIEQEQKEREQREAFLREQESERQKLIAIQKKEAQKLLEEQASRVAEQEERLLREAQEEQKRRLQEALKRLNIRSRHNSYEMTPDKVFKPSTENNYNIEDLSSADETDDEEAPRKEVPPWAEGLLLQKAIEETTKILRSGTFDPDTFFREIFPPDLSKIFGTSKKFPRRGSSGIWDSPIGKPRQGRTLISQSVLTISLILCSQTVQELSLM
ncbi:unnamed protein product [Haemonchus placei]|uniref:INCENP_ARK-bind domain-containing protein n=1 Tax=Haemonchus placei TaxID=6290 RepID=A0A0N4W236_HAEPC|nr:unnamed protein product [Haemonchus placei]